MNAPAIALKKIWYMMLSNFWTRIIFMYGVVMELANIAIGAGSYFFLTKVFQGTTEVMGRYGTDVVSYIILGIALNRMLSESLTGIYNAIVTSYQDHSMERIMISRTSIYTLLFSNMASGYLKHLIDAMLYLAMGALIFGINLGKGNAPLAILVLVLGMVSTFGLGMLLSQIFFYTSTGKGGPNAVLMLASTFANTFSGATFPVEVIIAYAPWLYPISAFLPQTHTLSVIRIILNGASLSDFSVLSHIIYLIIFAFITIPIGTYLFRKGLDHIRKEGYAPHELGIWLY